MSVGDDRRAILAARAAELAGDLVSPRIFASGRLFTAPGGHPIATILHGVVAQASNDLAVAVDDAVDGRRQVRRLIDLHDVDVIKIIYSTIPGDVPRLRRDLLEALVSEAHELRRPVLVHVSTPEEAAHCIAAGVDGLEHMVLGDDETLDRIFASAAEQGVFWTPTLCLFDKMAHDGDQRYIDDYRPEGFVSQAVLRSLTAPDAWWQTPDEGTVAPPWSRTVELTGRAHAAGVPLALGTDAGNPAVFHGLAVHRELELLTRAGIAPTRALMTATSLAAAKVRAGNRLGTVEPGKEADLVVLSADPLDDIRNTRQIDLVVKRGKQFAPAALNVP